MIVIFAALPVLLVVVFIAQARGALRDKPVELSSSRRGERR